MCQILIKSVAGIIMLWVEFFNNSKYPAPSNLEFFHCSKNIPSGKTYFK